MFSVTVTCKKKRKYATLPHSLHQILQAKFSHTSILPGLELTNSGTVGYSHYPIFDENP